MKGIMLIMLLNILSCSSNQIVSTIDNQEKNESYEAFKSCFKKEFVLPLELGQDYVFQIKGESIDVNKHSSFICEEINNCVFTSSYMKSRYYPIGYIANDTGVDLLLLGFFEPPFKRKITLLIGDTLSGEIIEKVLLWEDDQIKKRIISQINLDKEIITTYLYDTRNVVDRQQKSDSSLVKIKYSKIKIKDKGLEILEDTPFVNNILMKKGNTYILESLPPYR